MPPKKSKAAANLDEGVRVELDTMLEYARNQIDSIVTGAKSKFEKPKQVRAKRVLTDDQRSAQLERLAKARAARKTKTSAVEQPPV